MALSEQLLSIIVCPKCHGDLVYDESGAVLSCGACRLQYRIKDDIPNFLIEQAESY